MYVPVIRHTLGPDAVNAGLSVFEFILLVFAAVFLAAGGYIINDIVDGAADQVNKPGQNTIGTVFSMRQAYLYYWIFTIAGVVAGTVLSLMVHQVTFSVIFFLTAALLYSYARNYQCRPLSGNLIVALLSALSFGLVFVFELMELNNHHTSIQLSQQAFQLVFKATLVYMSFAFLVSLLREVVKDIEDVEGDRNTGCRTFAVTTGKNKARILALIVALLGLAASFVIQRVFYSRMLWFLFYYFFLVDILFGFIIFKLLKAREKSHFSSLSLWIKVLMLTGVLSMALFFFGG